MKHKIIPVLMFVMFILLGCNPEPIEEVTYDETVLRMLDSENLFNEADLIGKWEQNPDSAASAICIIGGKIYDVKKPKHTEINPVTLLETHNAVADLHNYGTWTYENNWLKFDACFLGYYYGHAFVQELTHDKMVLLVHEFLFGGLFSKDPIVENESFIRFCMRRCE